MMVASFLLLSDHNNSSAPFFVIFKQLLILIRVLWTVSATTARSHLTTLIPSCCVFSGKQQCRCVSAVSRPSEGVPGSAGGPGTTGPVALSPRERAFQPDHYV